MARERSWTDEDLIAAVAESTTLTEVLDRLGLSKGGASMGTVRRRILALGLDAPDLLRHARSASWAADPDDAMAHAPVTGRWTEAELRMAVATSTSMRQVMERLGYRGSGGAWTTAKAQILQLGLDTSHFSPVRVRKLVPLPPAPRRRTWSDADLRRAVANSRSMAGVIRHLNLKVGGSVYPMLRDRIGELGLDTSHFTGQGWSKGLSVTTRRGRPLSEILVANSDYRSTTGLRRRLLKEEIKEARCEGCGLTEWRGVPIPLQLDHIDGDRRNNRLENLRLLCPNCHAQTDTWCGKNKGRSARASTMAPAPRWRNLANARASSSRAERLEGSNPSRGTRPALQLTFGDLHSLD